MNKPLFLSVCPSICLSIPSVPPLLVYTGVFQGVKRLMSMSLKPSASSEQRGGIVSRKGYRKGLISMTNNSSGHMDPTAEEQPDPHGPHSGHMDPTAKEQPDPHGPHSGHMDPTAKSPAAHQNASWDLSQQGMGQEAPVPTVALPAPIPKFEADAIKAAHLTGANSDH